MYGENYGYRSGLNGSMVTHLNQKVKYLENMIELDSSDFVLDIGSNDATLLKAYIGNHKKIGIDPTGKYFQEYYTDDIILIPDFFNKEVFVKNFSHQKAKIITSIAMFYDLDDPRKFVKDIEFCLADDGVWHFEQSYMPSMLRTDSYDTICHEHIEFYSLKVVKDLLESCNMKIIDVITNEVNGGSFSVTASKTNSSYDVNTSIINWMLNREKDLELSTTKPYFEFKKRISYRKKHLVELINSLNKSGKKVFGYGASTKGNVILQYCGLTSDQIPYIAEVNEKKFGSFTPGTLIPIISEKEAKAKNPDYFLVLPWHFKPYILDREKDYITKGGKFIFPLPYIEII